uniref:Uncharacterized protein n=1 Tax=Lepeophtheirus salmonis TaxID=72036 RepID=A0A0K2VAL3_LEPSM
MDLFKTEMSWTTVIYKRLRNKKRNTLRIHKGGHLSMRNISTSSLTGIIEIIL